MQQRYHFVLLLPSDKKFFFSPWNLLIYGFLGIVLAYQRIANDGLAGNFLNFPLYTIEASVIFYIAVFSLYTIRNLVAKFTKLYVKLPHGARGALHNAPKDEVHSYGLHYADDSSLPLFPLIFVCWLSFLALLWWKVPFVSAFFYAKP